MGRCASTSDRLAFVRLFCVGVGFSIAGCGTDPCNPAIDPNGGRYDVYVGDLYPSDSTANDRHGFASQGSCAGFDGVVPETTLTFETFGAIETAEFCRSTVAEILTGPPDLTPLPAPTDPLSDEGSGYGPLFMEARASVAAGGCSGLAIFLFFEAGPMYRVYEPATGSCPPCDDNFAVTMLPL
jgi:hypothetical protein